MRQRIHSDIRASSFDEFVVFVFDRDVPPEPAASLADRGEAGPARRPWYFDVDVSFDPQRICSYYVQMFTAPSFLAERFSDAQLQQGFEAMQVNSPGCSVRQIIWLEDLPFRERAHSVRAMVSLFRELFLSEPLGSTASMWWDSFCFAWECGNRKRSRGGEDLAMQDVIFEALAEVLSLPSEICQGAALHGLSHLHHPGTPELLQQYVSAHSSLGAECKQFALRVAGLG
jgi:hypothetical protein